ncbi:hypothetical protein [Bernardetia sp. MNP-M8]|uniref:hypothetical protein n=1 Tax=Bernardetia sp. MNP-M8 TaxID=3127470 RepID=UPI0030D3703F
MTYHSHKLDSTHSHIIGRTDPITGDTIKEEDKVTFCLTCHSCFLEESWNYMNNRHCEQNETLKFIPFPPPQLIAKKKEQKLIAELKESTINPFPSIIAFVLFVCIFSVSGVSPIISFLLSLFFSVVVGVIFR